MWSCTNGGEKYNTVFWNLIFSALIGEGNVFIDGKPVCDDDWDLNDAKVACRQLGFSNAVRATAGKNTKF